MFTPTPAAAVISIVSALIEKSIVIIRSIAKYAKTPATMSISSSSH